MESNQIESVLIQTVDYVEVYYVLNQEVNEISSGPLDVIYLSNYNTFVIRVDDFNYNLSKDIPVMLKPNKEDSLCPVYVFPNVEGYYVVKIIKIADIEALNRFETILKNHTNLMFETAVNEELDSNVMIKLDDKSDEAAAEKKKPTTMESAGKMAAIGGQMAYSGAVSVAKATGSGLSSLASYGYKWYSSTGKKKDDKKEEEEKKEEVKPEAEKNEVVFKNEEDQIIVLKSDKEAELEEAALIEQKKKESQSGAGKAIANFTKTQADNLMSMGRNIASKVNFGGKKKEASPKNEAKEGENEGVKEIKNDEGASNSSEVTEATDEKKKSVKSPLMSEEAVVTLVQTASIVYLGYTHASKMVAAFKTNKRGFYIDAGRTAIKKIGEYANNK